MDEATKERIKHEIEDRAKTLFPVRRVEWLQYGDQPMIEPGELLPAGAEGGPHPARRSRHSRTPTARHSSSSSTSCHSGGRRSGTSESISKTTAATPGAA
jgi:hypothetical protein